MNVIEIKKKDSNYETVIYFLNTEYDKKNRGIQFWEDRFKNNISDRVGYGLFIKNNLVGFIGLIQYENILALSSWFILKSYRKYSMNFLLKVMKLIGDEKIVNSSPNPIAFKIFHNLYNFKHKCEYVGIPKILINFDKIQNQKIYFGKRINVYYNQKVSIIQLLYLSLKYKKICLALHPNKNYFLFSKKINVLYKNLAYSFPLSISGDIFD